MSDQYTQSRWLTLLTHAPADDVKALAEGVLDALGEITVINNRTGLVMQPYTDSAEGTAFHLGEVLVAEAHIRLASGVEGYGLVTGRDTVFAMGVAVLDAALQSGIAADTIEPFLAAQQEAQQAADEKLLRQVEATRVEMETF
jgi:alpha-D-ribose 1-methylphosphonate 5-triphosphate synthase subunit PhnG